jgi:hypothetical protein
MAKSTTRKIDDAAASSRQSPKRHVRCCPQCRQPLRFALRSPVISPSDPLTGTSERDRLHYASAWICQTPRCGYREVMGEQVREAE